MKKLSYLKEFQNFNPNPEDQFPQLDGIESNNDELSREEMEEPLEVVSGFEDEEVEEMSDVELKDMYDALEKDIEKRNEGFIKTFESFNENISNREEMIETLCNTSNFEKGELEEMTDEELEYLYNSLETEDWLDELDNEDSDSFDEFTILIPMRYRGIIMELGEEVDPNEIISMYNDIVASEGESIPLVSYSEYGTEGKFYNENDDEIPTDSILDELNYAIGLDNSGDSDEFDSLDEAKKSGVTASLKKKSKASGIPMGILRKVFSKGMQAWNAGHRPGVAQHQWGMGRVNSFITGSGGARKADADLWKKAKAAKARKRKKKKK